MIYSNDSAVIQGTVSHIFLIEIGRYCRLHNLFRWYISKSVQIVGTLCLWPLLKLNNKFTKPDTHVGNPRLKGVSSLEENC